MSDAPSLCVLQCILLWERHRKALDQSDKKHLSKLAAFKVFDYNHFLRLKFSKTEPATSRLTPISAHRGLVGLLAAEGERCSLDPEAGSAAAAPTSTPPRVARDLLFDYVCFMCLLFCLIMFVLCVLFLYVLYVFHVFYVFYVCYCFNHLFGASR